MTKLPNLGFSKLLAKKTKVDGFRILSISTLFILISTILQPAPVDMIFVLLIESLCLIVIMVLSFFLSMSLFVLILGLLTSIVLVPLLLYFLFVALMFITLMLGFNSMADGTSPYELVKYSIQVLDGDWQVGIQSMITYFGTDFYWIVGGVFLHHFIFDIVLYYKRIFSTSSKKEREDNAMDLLFNSIIKAMVQSSMIMLFGLIMAIPIVILTLCFSSQLWVAYIIIILFRIGLEWFEKSSVDIES